MIEEKIITINERGTEYTFLIRQMPAKAQQRFMLQVMSAISPQDVDMQDINLEKMMSINIFAALRGLDVDYAEKIIDGLYPYAYQKNGEALTQLSPQLVNNIFYDIRNLMTLQKEIISHSFSFFTQEGTVKPSAIMETTKEAVNSFDMRTSQAI